MPPRPRLLSTRIVSGGTASYPLYDGNGNITQYLNSAGTVVAWYEHSPFGYLLASGGTLAADLEFRFSTKKIDTETDFYYYGYRYYSPWMARWINRDPIGEEGGVNLYGFVWNDAVNRWDKLGHYGSTGRSYSSPYDYYDLFAEPKAQSQINSFSDALSHYRSGAGGVVPAGQGLYDEMRADDTYENRVKSDGGWVAGRIKERLEKVSKDQTTGTIESDSSSFVGQLNSTTLGSYGLSLSYNATWNAGAWQKRWHSFLTKSCYREVSTTVTVNFTLNGDWNFHWNPQYSRIKNIMNEVIPGWIAGARGTPADFDISGSLTETYNLKVEQDK